MECFYKSFFVGLLLSCLSICHGQDSVFVYNQNLSKIYYFVDYTTLYIELDRNAPEVGKNEAIAEMSSEAIAEMSSYSEVENVADNIYRLHIDDSSLREGS